MRGDLSLSAGWVSMVKSGWTAIDRFLGDRSPTKESLGAVDVWNLDTAASQARARGSDCQSHPSDGSSLFRKADTVRSRVVGYCILSVYHIARPRRLNTLP